MPKPKDPLTDLVKAWRREANQLRRVTSHMPDGDARDRVMIAVSNLSLHARQLSAAIKREETDDAK